MKRCVGGLVLALSMAGCASGTPVPSATNTIEVRATETISATVEATAGEVVTETALPTITALPVLTRYEAITEPPINAAAFSPDGARLAYVTTAGITMLDAANDYAVVWTVDLPGVDSFGLVWSADGTRLLTIRSLGWIFVQPEFHQVQQGVVVTLDAESGEQISGVNADSLVGAWGSPTALSKDGIHYAIAGGGGWRGLTLGRTDYLDEQELFFEPPYDQNIVMMGVAFSADGGLVAASAEPKDSAGGSVQIWDMTTREVVAQFNVNSPGLLAFSPDASQIAVLSGQEVGGSASGLHVFDLTSGEEVWSQYGEFQSLAWSEFGIYTEMGGWLVRYHPETGNRYEREGLVFPAYLATTWLEASEYGVIRVTPEYLHVLDAEEMSSRVLASGFLPVGDAGLGASPYREVATYAPDGSAVAIRSHSYIWVRSAESTYWKGIEGVGALAWSPDSKRIAIGSGEEISIWEVWGALVGRIESPIPVQEVFWLADDVIVVAGNVGTHAEQVGGWDVPETALAGIDVTTGEVMWERGGFSAVRHVSGSVSGLMVIEEQRGDQGDWHLMNFDATVGFGNAAGRLEDSPFNFPAVISPDGTRVIVRGASLYSLLNNELGLIGTGGGAVPGAIQWAADSGSVMAMTGMGHYYVWDREMGAICNENGRIGFDGLARAINPNLGEVIFETPQRVLEVWRINGGCE